jgi:hypothetical protein
MVVMSYTVRVLLLLGNAFVREARTIAEGR